MDRTWRPPRSPLGLTCNARGAGPAEARRVQQAVRRVPHAHLDITRKAGKNPALRAPRDASAVAAARATAPIGAHPAAGGARRAVRAHTRRALLRA